MKKLLALFLALSITVFAFAGCGTGDVKPSGDPLITIKVGASPTPHKEILEQCIPYLNENGYDLKIVEFTDYVLPNKALEGGDIDANYFQHKPYLDDQIKENDYAFTSAYTSHFEPFGIYTGGEGTTFADLKAGDKIAIPDDLTNGARALQLLAANNVIEITNDKGLNTTVKDIDAKGLEIIELQASLIGTMLPELAFGVINGNYALDFDIVDKRVAYEESSSVAASTYANLLVVNTADIDSAKTKILVEALSQQSVKDYIKNSFDGLVLPYIA